jgi:serine/threonine protein kinase/tetratricopeptide (TPR) repeat protein
VTNPNSDPLVGRTVGQYQILARVGGGGMGVVYTARDTRLSRIVALKFLPPQWSHDASAKERFVREAQAASATNHPNICTVHDIETADDGQLFIVMAYYEGDTLKKRLESGPLPIEEALDIATQVADGLAKAHAQGVVHRDIKPGNLILTEDGVRILDFGLATFADALKLTAENAPLGTVAYMSPEQVRGQRADSRADVWATGAVLYEMLTGHAPFRGSHTEAIGYAVRNEQPTPIREERAEVPEEVEQLVFRALHKEASVRYASGRELARALRQVRGMSVPIELRTDVVVPPSSPRPRRWYTRPPWRRIAALVVLLSLVTVGLGAWALMPAPRIPIAILPIVNLTGYRELEPHRLGLTHALSAGFVDSPTIRVIGHEQLSSILEGFRDESRDIASGEASRAIASHSGAKVLVVVTILNEGQGFKARAEFRGVDTSINEGASFETDAEVSTLVKDAAYRLVPPLAAGIEAHFTTTVRGRLAEVARRVAGRAVPHPLPARTLEASTTLERGLAAFESLEYGKAFQLFGDAVQQDPFNPLLIAWRSRVAAAMRRDTEAEALAREASSTLSVDTAGRQRLLIEAIAAESRRDPKTAAERYKALREENADDPMGLQELAAFHDRQGQSNNAITGYLDALALDPHLVRPHLELCRLYNRVGQLGRAREHGRAAVDAYAALSAPGGQAQGLMCLTDSMRVGNDRERDEARQVAETALEIVRSHEYPYNLPRAYNYVALALEAQGKLREAAAMWEQSLVANGSAMNRVLQPLVDMNLGVTYTSLGRRPQAVEHFDRSARGFESLGDRSRAAENQFNIGTLFVSYGRSADGFRLIADALEVFRRVPNHRFEVLASLATATHHLNSGQPKDAERELNKARSIAAQWDLTRETVPISIRLGQTYLASGQYESARNTLVKVLPQAMGREHVRALTYLGQTYIRLGDLPSARAALKELETTFQNDRDAALLPLTYVTRAALARELGDLADARRMFRSASDLLTTELPDDTAVDARMNAAVLDAQSGHVAQARAAAKEALDIARQMGNIVLTARGHLALAQIEISDGSSAQTLTNLEEVLQGAASEDPELKAQTLYWTARALAWRGDASRAAELFDAARQTLRGMAGAFPEQYRSTFLSRRTIAPMLR